MPHLMRDHISQQQSLAVTYRRRLNPYSVPRDSDVVPSGRSKCDRPIVELRIELAEALANSKDALSFPGRFRSHQNNSHTTVTERPAGGLNVTVNR